MDAWRPLRIRIPNVVRDSRVQTLEKRFRLPVDPNAMNGTGNRTRELRSLFGGDLVSHPVRVRDWFMD